MGYVVTRRPTDDYRDCPQKFLKEIGMPVLFRTISEAEFVQIPNKIFSDPTYDRRFGRVDSDGVTYALGWRSHLLEPVVLDLGDGVFFVGVDQDAAIVESGTGRVLIRLNLSEFFVKAVRVGNKLILATELAVYELIGPVWGVNKRHDLPDTFEEFEFSSESVGVICMDGSKLKL